MDVAVVGGGGGGVFNVKNLNLSHNIIVIEATAMEFHTHVHHHKGYNLSKEYNNYVMLFDRIWRITVCPFTELAHTAVERCWSPCAWLLI